MTSEFVDQIKVKLQAEKIRLEQELAKFTHRNPHAVQADYDANFPNLGDKEDENAAEVAEFSTNLSLEGELEKVVRDIDSALRQIEKGVYGTCKYCKQPIDEKRLEARPTSSSCIKCKKTLTQEV